MDIEKNSREKCKAEDGCGVYEDTMIGLLQAVSIEKGFMPLKEVPGMPTKTYRVSGITMTENSSLVEKTMPETSDCSEGD